MTTTMLAKCIIQSHPLAHATCTQAKAPERGILGPHGTAEKRGGGNRRCGDQAELLEKACEVWTVCIGPDSRRRGRWACAARYAMSALGQKQTLHFYSISSSASERRLLERCRPSALAVFILIANSNLVIHGRERIARSKRHDQLVDKKGIRLHEQRTGSHLAQRIERYFDLAI